MIIRFTGAVVGGSLLVLAATTGSFAQAGGFTPSASASSQEIADHQATVRAEMLYAKCKQQYGVWPEVLSVRAPNSLTAACMRNGGRKI